VRQVEKECAGKLKGIYWLNLPLLPPTKQDEQKKLVECLCNISLNKTPDLKTGESINIGTHVEQCLERRIWPTNSLPLEIYLGKERDDTTLLSFKSFSV